MSSIADRFTKIYESKAWHPKILSGAGSDPKRNVRYLRLVQRLVNSGRYKTVLDVGCGDWSLGQCIDWRPVQYHGVDVVAHVIAGNQQKFGGDSITFSCLNLLQDPLPSADLVIIKDVLQHLPTP